MVYILFNPLSNNSRGERESREWAAKNIKEECEFIPVLGLNFIQFFDSLKSKDIVYLRGGDGTLGRFADETYGYNFKNELYYVKGGSGNDFYRDVVADPNTDEIVDIKKYLKKLPVMSVNGIKRHFINGVGYGLDGETCMIGDEMKENDPELHVNYTSIAIKLLLGKYKLRKAHVVVDDKEYDFENVWVCSGMYGKYYGGGMKAAPNKDRLANKDTIDLITLSSKGRINTLLRFPKFSSGEHDGKKYISHIEGKHIKVSFDIPCSLQIDGDVIKDVASYEVFFE